MRVDEFRVLHQLNATLNSCTKHGAHERKIPLVFTKFLFLPVVSCCSGQQSIWFISSVPSSTTLPHHLRIFLQYQPNLPDVKMHSVAPTATEAFSFVSLNFSNSSSYFNCAQSSKPGYWIFVHYPVIQIWMDSSIGAAEARSENQSS